MDYGFDQSTTGVIKRALCVNVGSNWFRILVGNMHVLNQELGEINS